jgi:hypothetical protein
VTAVRGIVFVPVIASPRPGCDPPFSAAARSLCRCRQSLPCGGRGIDSLDAAPPSVI